MKRYWMCFAMLLALATGATAADWGLGVDAGVAAQSVSNVHYRFDPTSTDVQALGQIGLRTNVWPTESLFISAVGRYTAGSENEMDAEFSMNLDNFSPQPAQVSVTNNLQLVLTANPMISNRLFLCGGVSVLTAEVSESTTDTNEAYDIEFSESYRNTDVGIVLGLGYSLGRMALRAQYVASAQGRANLDDLTWRREGRGVQQSSVLLSASYTFLGK